MIYQLEIIKEIIELRGDTDVAEDIDILYTEKIENTLKTVGFYMVDNNIKIITKEEYTQYVREQKINQLLND